MKKIITLSAAAIFAIGLTGCGNTYYNMAPGQQYRDVAPVVYQEAAPVHVQKVIVQDPHRYLRRNSHGYRYYY